MSSVTGVELRTASTAISPATFGSSSYAREELVAEMTGAFVCAALSIVPTVRHADYLASWLEVLREDNRAIIRAASAASKAADYLLAFRSSERRRPPDAAALSYPAHRPGLGERSANGSPARARSSAAAPADLRNLQAELHVRALPLSLIYQGSGRATLASCDRLLRRGPTRFLPAAARPAAERAANRPDRRDCQPHRANRPRRRPRIHRASATTAATRVR